MNTAGFMIDKTHALGLRLHTPTRRHADTPGFVAPKWAKDFSLGRSPRNIEKSDQALKALQKKLRSAIYRGKELVQAFLRPYRAGRILHAFPGASPQALVFRPFQGARSPIRRYADTPIRFLLCFVLLVFAFAGAAEAATDPTSEPAPTAQAAPPPQPAQTVQPTETTQPAGSPEPAVSPSPFTRSQNVTINLINRLVQRGVLTKEDAAELIKMAEEDAAAARAEAAQEAQARQAAQTVPLPTATASPESATAQELATS